MNDDILAGIIVCVTVAGVYGLSAQKNRWVKRLLEWVPAILFAYVIPATITHIMHYDLSRVVLHDWSKTYIIPMAILLVMSALSFKQLRVIGLRPIILFVGGSFVIAVSAPILLLAFRVFDPVFGEVIIDNGYWKGLVPIVGSWIGGSTSQLVLKELVECPEGIFLAILVLDNVLVNIWTILMFQCIKKSDTFNRLLNIHDTIPDFVPDDLSGNPPTWRTTLWTAVSLISMLFITLFFQITFLWTVVILSFAGLILGNFLSFWNHTLVLKTGGILIVLIMSILGLKLDFGSFSLPGVIIIFVMVWLVLHFIVMIFMARAMNLHTAWIPIASMANLGGISTAPAVTAAYNEEWMPHAIILAILSMVSGTAWGFLTIYLFKLIFL